MLAAIANRYGGPEVLSITEMPTPAPKSDEVLVKVFASAVTQADIMIRTGKPYFGRAFLGWAKPRQPIPGTSFAGKIVATGSGVARFKVGDGVFGETTTGFATQAQYVAVPETGIIQPIPHNMDYAEAAPVSDGPLTVHNFLTRLVTIRPGMKVLINGAAGGLGTAAVQYAIHLGAEVTGVASGRNRDLVLGLGADHFIDYASTDFTKGGDRYDVIFDTVGKVPFSRARRALTADGTYLSPVLTLGILAQMLVTGRFSRQKAKFSATGLLPHDVLREDLAVLRAMIEDGMLSTHIDRRYPLAGIAEAHRYVQSGHKRGAVVLEIAPEVATVAAAA